MKCSNFKCNRHGRLNKLYVNSEENFKTKYLTRCLETRNFSNLLVFFISGYFGMNFSKLNIWIKYTGKQWRTYYWIIHTLLKLRLWKESLKNPRNFWIFNQFSAINFRSRLPKDGIFQRKCQWKFYLMHHLMKVMCRNCKWFYYYTTESH